MAASGNKLTVAVEEYLSELRRIRATGAGTEERSYYPALRDLLNSVGGTLRPKVFGIIELGQQGAGHPDIGLFAAGQVQKGQPKQGQLPDCGVVEVKPARRRCLAHLRQRPGQPVLGALPARAGHQHPRLRAAGRRLTGQPGQAGDLPAGRVRRQLRGTGCNTPAPSPTASARRWPSTWAAPCPTGPRWRNPATWPGCWPPTPATGWPGSKRPATHRP